jgi:hypothetical protein
VLLTPRLSSLVLALTALIACQPEAVPAPAATATVAPAASDPVSASSASTPAIASASAPAPSASVAAPAASAPTPPAPPAIEAGTPVVPAARLALFEITGSPPNADDPLNWGVAIDGLPAVTDDGAVIAAIGPGDDWRTADGTRPYLLALDVAHDRPSTRMTLVTTAEARALVAVGQSKDAAHAASKRAEVAAAGRKRLGELQAWLAARQWVHMVDLKLDESGTLVAPASRFGGGPHELTGDYDGKRLKVHDDRGVIFDRAFPGWQVPGGPPAPGSAVVCGFRPDLVAIAVEPTRRAMLLTVAQQEIAGGDFCDLTATLHAVRLTR